MTRNLIATAILIGTASLGMGAYAQTTSNAVPTRSTGVPTTSPGVPTSSTGVPTSTNDAPANTLGTLHRDVHQQQRIEDGLQNGTITTRESAELERNQARINELQSKAMHNGSLSPTERSELDRLQDHQSRAIKQANVNGVNGNPMSASSQRAQSEVQRNISQQTRIQEGVHDNSLTEREAGHLEAGQARSDAHQYEVGRDGKISAQQAQQMKEQDNRQSEHIYGAKRDRQQGHR